MSIIDSTKDYGTGVVLMLWDGEVPTRDEFLAFAFDQYGVVGKLEINQPSDHKGGRNPGTATVTP